MRRARTERRNFGPVSAHARAAPSPAMRLRSVVEPQGASASLATSNEVEIPIRQQIRHGFCDRGENFLNTLPAVNLLDLNL